MNLSCPSCGRKVQIRFGDSRETVGCPECGYQFHGAVHFRPPPSLAPKTEVAATGSIAATLRNVGGNTVNAPGTRLVLYTNPTQSKRGSNPFTFSNVPTGTYLVEGYQTGTFWGEEFWASQPVTVKANQTAEAELKRDYPYAVKVTFYDNATNQVVSAGQGADAGRVIRAEVTVKNRVESNRDCYVHLVADQDKSPSYDFDQISSTQTVSGNGGTRVFTFTYTTKPSATGAFYYALEVNTTVNGRPTRTDSWNWTKPDGMETPPSQPKVDLKAQYLGLLEDICRLSADEYRAQTLARNAFVRRAREDLRDRVLARRMEGKDRDSAVDKVKRRIYERKLVDGHAGDPLYHAFAAMVQIAIDRGLTPGSLQDLSRRGIIIAIQVHEHHDPCVGQRYSTCEQRRCLWRADCKEMTDLPCMGLLKGEVRPTLAERPKPLPAPAPKAASPPVAPPPRPSPPERPSIAAASRGPAAPARAPSAPKAVSPAQPVHGRAGAKAVETPFDRSVSFPTAEAMLQFADVLISSGVVSTEARRELAVRVVDGRTMGLLLPSALDQSPTDIRNAIRILGGTLGCAFPAGETLGLNAYLERVHLRPQTSMPAQLDCLFVLQQGATAESLGEVYRSFPHGEYAESRFLMGSYERGDERVQAGLVLFERLKSVPRVSQWARHLPPGTTVFYPIHGYASDRFFCQWQFVHPVMSLSRLYEDGDTRYTLMGEPGSGAKPWVRISQPDAEKSIVSAHQVFAVSLGEGDATPVDMKPEAAIEPVRVRLRASRASERGLATTGRLSLRIESMRRRLADLEAKNESIQQTTRGQCRMALLFAQNPEIQELPPRLRRFLDRPYQTLDSYTYFYLPVKGRHCHALFSKNPMPLSDALVGCADALYLQDARWQSWGLNVFLRHSVEVSPRLDDPAMVGQFDAFFKHGDSQNQTECCLVDAPSPGAGDRPIDVIPVPRTLPLPEMIRFFNERFAGATHRLVAALPAALSGSLATRAIELGDHLKKLQWAIVRDVGAHADATQADWRVLHERLLAAQTQIQESEKAVQDIEKMLSSLPPAWEEFFNRVLKLHLDLSREKRGAFDRLKSAAEGFQEKVDEAQKANQGAQRGISEAEATLTKGQAGLAEAEAQTAQAFRQVTQLQSDYTGARRKLLDRILETKTRLTTELNAARAEEQQVLQQVREAEAKLAEATQVRSATSRETRLLGEKLQQLERTVQGIAADRAAIAAGTVQLQAGHRQVEESRKQLAAARQRHQKEVQRVNAQGEALKGELRKLRQAAKSIAPLGAAIDDLLLSIRMPPGVFGRLRAEGHFGRVLKLAPESFWLGGPLVQVAPATAPTMTPGQKPGVPTEPAPHPADPAGPPAAGAQPPGTGQNPPPSAPTTRNPTHG